MSIIAPKVQPCFATSLGLHLRYHLLEALERALDVGAARDIIFHIVDKRSKGNPSRVGRRVLARRQSKLLVRSRCFGGRKTYPTAAEAILERATNKCHFQSALGRHRAAVQTRTSLHWPFAHYGGRQLRPWQIVETLVLQIWRTSIKRIPGRTRHSRGNKRPSLF